jgi:hypothetical protein
MRIFGITITREQPRHRETSEESLARVNAMPWDKQIAYLEATDTEGFDYRSRGTRQRMGLLPLTKPKGGKI